MPTSSIHFHVSPGKYSIGDEGDPMFRLSRRLAWQVVNRRRKYIVDEDGYIPSWFSHRSEVARGLTEAWNEIPSEEIASLKELFSYAQHLDRALAESVLVERIDWEDDWFGRSFLTDRSIWLQSYEPVADTVRQLMRDSSISPLTLRNLLLWVMNVEALGPDIIEYLRNLEERDFEVLSGCVDTKTVDVVKQEFLLQVGRRLEPGVAPSEFHPWFSRLLSFLEDGHSETIARDGRELIRKALQTFEPEKFVFELKHYDIKRLAPLALLEAEPWLNIIWDLSGWTIDPKSDLGDATILGLLRIDFFKYEALAFCEWNDEASKIQKWRIERVLLRVEEESSRRWIDDEMLEEIEQKGPNLRFAHSYLRQRVLPENRSRYWDLLRSELNRDRLRELFEFAWYVRGTKAVEFWESLRLRNLCKHGSRPNFEDFERSYSWPSRFPHWDLWEDLANADYVVHQNYDTDERPPPYADLLLRMREVAGDDFLITAPYARLHGGDDWWVDVSFELKGTRFDYRVEYSKDYFSPDTFFQGVNAALAEVGAPGRFAMLKETDFVGAIYGTPEKVADFGAEFFLAMEYRSGDGTLIPLFDEKEMIEAFDAEIFR